MLWLVWSTLLPAAAAQSTTPLGPSITSSPSPSDGYSLASQTLLSTMNLEADPCSDFYEFVCGNFPKTHPIAANAVTNDYFEILDEKVRRSLRESLEDPAANPSKAITMTKSLYRSCMNQKTIDFIGPRVAQQELDSIGSWPILDGGLRSKENCSWVDFDLTRTLLKVYLYRQMDIFFSVTPTIDPKNSSRRMLSIDQADLGMGSREMYLKPEQFEEQIEAYRTMLIQFITQFANDTRKVVNASKVEEDVDAVINFETILANISEPADERTNISAMYHLEKLDNLQERFPFIDWKKFLLLVAPTSVHPYLNSNPDVLLYEPEYLERLNSVLDSTPNGVIANYILLQYLGGLHLQLGTAYEDIEQEFLYHLEGRKEKSPREKDCINVLNAYLPYTVGSIYVRKSFDAGTRNATIRMITSIKETFRRILAGSDWMDPETRKYALEKLDKLDALVGYPDFILDDKKLDAFYAELSISASDPFIYGNGKVLRFLLDYSFARLDKPVDRNEFTQTAAQINAFYESSHNNIVIPAAILQPPFFHKDYPAALNYGGIGAVVGHEMTHGFDTSGSQFDAEGSLRNWWDEKVGEDFLNRSECMVDQYGSVEVPGTNMTINGLLTRGENIADNGGVKESFMACKTWLQKNGPERPVPGLEKFSNEQLFFLGYGQVWCGHETLQILIQDLLQDPHSPMKYRVNIPLSNLPDFARVYNCSAGTPMNPTDKCSVW